MIICKSECHDFETIGKKEVFTESLLKSHSPFVFAIDELSFFQKSSPFFIPKDLIFSFFFFFFLFFFFL